MEIRVSAHDLLDLWESSLLLWIVHDLERIAQHSALVAQQALLVAPPASLHWVDRVVSHTEQVGR